MEEPLPLLRVNVSCTKRVGQFSAVNPSEDLASGVELGEHRRLVELLHVLLQGAAPSCSELCGGESYRRAFRLGS